MAECLDTAAVSEFEGPTRLDDRPAHLLQLSIDHTCQRRKGWITIVGKPRMRNE